MKTGTEALSARLLSTPLPESLIVPAGDVWPQSRTDVAKHPELGLLGTRRGAPIERRLHLIVADARQRDVPDVTIVLIAEALNVARYPDYIVSRLTAIADSLDIVFFARHQAPALTSVVAHRVQSWTSPNFTELDFDLVMREAKGRFRYDEYLERWAGDGHELIPIPYFEDDRTTDGLMTRITKQVGIPVPTANTAEPKNASLGKEQLERLGRLKTSWAWARRFPIARHVAPTIFYQARKRIQREKPGTRWVLSAGEQRQVRDAYRESNARFKKMLGSAARRADWKRWFAEAEPRTNQ
jgi:hypothetical protein